MRTLPVSLHSMPPANELAARQARVWQQVCYMAEGLAIAPAIDSLLRHERIVARKRADCSRAPWGNPGFVGVARRALAQQGRLPPRSSEHDAWLRGLDWYRLVPALLESCRAIQAGEPSHACQAVPVILRSSKPTRDVPDRVATELLAFIAAPTVLALADNERLPPFQPEPFALPSGIWAVGRTGRLAQAALRWLGWIDGPASAPALTIEGRMGAAFSGQLRYPLSYLPMLTRMDALLFGDPGIALERDSDQTESHLDRAADIRFSTEVFQRNCAPPLLAMALPLFERGRAGDRPRIIVDVGCGDATVLVSLFNTIATRIASADAAQDLLLVGIENNPVAEQAAKRTLAACGAKYLLARGDISHPEAIARRLATEGIDLSDALHINKSVIHDRELVGTPQALSAADTTDSDGVFAMPDGTLIGAATAQDDLVRFFQRWRPYLIRHGMITMEPHALTIDAAAALSGRSLSSVMEALHGFSCQYLSTLERFNAALHLAGLRLAEQRLIGSELTGHVYMSCSHFTVEGDSR
ncbi:hypothetical protein AB4Y38_42020 [Paraburkholderia sp. EG285A]|uniref:AprA-related methyltransferase n=1 Tax=Paraburkholderia sp. EG285A TaxID=3237009 RepID=UPI0034D34653